MPNRYCRIEDEERGRMGKRWWDYLIVAAAVGNLCVLVRDTQIPALRMDVIGSRRWRLFCW
jgi:hypothetical protein